MKADSHGSPQLPRLLMIRKTNREKDVTVLEKLKNMLVPKLAGISYAEMPVESAPPTVPPNFIEKTIDQFEPALAETERQIRAHRRNDFLQEWEVLPRSVAEKLREHDKAVGQAAVADEVTGAARQAQAIQNEFSDVPVLPAKQKTRAVSDEEMRRRDRELRLQLAQDEKSLVPVMRRVA